MERSNQPPKTEGCETEGGPPDLRFWRAKRPPRSVPREKREPQAGVASRISNTASKGLNASEVAVLITGLHTEAPAHGEGAADLPGSKSVASAEGSAGNRGGPETSCRTNYEGQAGRVAQRQEVPPGSPGVGSAHSIQRQGERPEAGEGADVLAKPPQATCAVRLTEHHRQTSLGAKTTCQHEEPGAGKPPAGICEGGAGQPASLPQPRYCLGGV